MRTLVMAPNWVGDIVMALPVLDSLAASGRTVVVAAKPHLLPLLRQAAPVAEVVERDPDSAVTVERLRAAACPEAVILPNSFRSAWLPFRAEIAYRWGYSGAWRSLLLHPGVPAPRRVKRHQTEDYRELLAAMGVGAPVSWTPRLGLPEETRREGQRRLERGHIALGGGRLVGLSPGAEFGPSKRWPWRRFAELATALRRRLPGARIVLLAGPKDLWTAVRVHEDSGRIHPVIGPDLDLGGLAGVLSHLDLLVTNDSGPMHLAAALGVRCVALFGPTDPSRTAPAGEGHRVLYTNRWCSPCFRRRCPLLHHKCLKEITVEQVAQACVATLESSKK